MSDLDTDLLKALANYSNDLRKLEKRDGELPAQAAIKAIRHAFLSRLPEKETHGKMPNTLGGQFIEGESKGFNRCLDEMKERLS